MLLRHGPLLLHDIEEALGSGAARASPSRCTCCCCCCPSSPSRAGAGSSWWLALLFVYMGLEESDRRAGVPAGLASPWGRPCRPLDDAPGGRPQPALLGGVAAVEGGSDPRAVARLEAAAQAAPDDRDLAYPAGRPVQEGRPLRRRGRPLPRAPADAPDDPSPSTTSPTSSSRGASSRPPSRATSRARRSRTTPTLKATFYYNLSLAHLQRFEYQPADGGAVAGATACRGLIANLRQPLEVRQGRLRGGGPGPHHRRGVGRSSRACAQGVGQKNVCRQGPGARRASRSCPALMNRFARLPGRVRAWSSLVPARAGAGARRSPCAA